jgi:hypothetical protein
MTTATIPLNEELRLQDLYSYDLLDTAAESDFDDLVELASQICKCPISLISLLDKDRQWFKARYGIEEQSTPRDVAFCSHAILHDDVMIVEDSMKDERFLDNPLATGSMNIRFYAGAPIMSPTGHKLGTICLIDHKPKVLTAEEQRALHLLSNQVTKLLEIRRRNMVIRQRAEEIVTLKSRAIRNVMSESETDKKAIANDLHEGFAQEIASSILYLKMAEEQDSNRLSFVQKAKDQLHTTLVSMRSLSSTLMPVGFDWMSPQDAITEFIGQTLVTYPFTIVVEPSGRNEPVQVEITLAAIRIMEKWLRTLTYKSAITSVRISVDMNEQLVVRVQDNGFRISNDQKQKDIVETGIYDKVHAFGGMVDLTAARGGGNLFRFDLPLFS